MSNLEDEDKVTSIEKIDGAKTSKVTEEALDPVTRVPPDREHFDSLMKQNLEKDPAHVSVEKTDGGTLMDQIRDINVKVEGVSKASPDTIISQSGEVIKQIEDVKSKLATPGLELKSSVQNLMQNKLTHIDESLKVALNRAGIEYTPQTAAPSNLIGPIEKFIGLLTHGQYQLQRLSNDVAMMDKADGHFTPANMLAIQIKVGYVQQEIELFTNILNKSLESIKTIMNVQI